MAWSDILQGTRSSLGDALNRKTTRDQGRLNRLSDALSRLGAQKYGREQQEDTQEHEAFLQQQDQAAATALEGVRQEGATARSGAEIAAAAERQATEHEYQSTENQRNRDLQEKLLGLTNNATLTEIKARARADIEAARELQDIQRGVYDDGSYHSPTNNKTYRWDTLEQFEAAMLDMENDAYINRIALQEKYGDDADNYIPLYIEARDIVMTDFQGQGLWDGKNWLGLPTPEQRAAAIQRFSDMVNRDSRYAPFAEDMIQDFTKYVNEAAVPDDTDSPGAGDLPTMSWEDILKGSTQLPVTTTEDVRASLSEGVQEEGIFSPFGFASIAAGANPFLHKDTLPDVTEKDEEDMIAILENLIGKAQSLGEVRTMEGYRDKIAAEGLIEKNDMLAIVEALKRLGVGVNE